MRLVVFDRDGVHTGALCSIVSTEVAAYHVLADLSELVLMERDEFILAAVSQAFVVSGTVHFTVLKATVGA